MKSHQFSWLHQNQTFYSFFVSKLLWKCDKLLSISTLSVFNTESYDFSDKCFIFLLRILSFTGKYEKSEIAASSYSVFIAHVIAD